jgi:hypothetical protein
MRSTGCVAEDSWRRGGWCALVGNGFTTFMIQDARSHEIKICFVLVDVSIGRGCYWGHFVVECRYDGLYGKSASWVLASQLA